jgi:hypothetical protein
MGALCGHIRPRDGITTCDRPTGHDPIEGHVVLGSSRPDGDSGAIYTPYLAEWSDDGTETCSGCGHKLDSSGMCTAPLSAAD